MDLAGTPLGPTEKQIFTLESKKAVTNHDSDDTWVVNVNSGFPGASPFPRLYEIYIFAYFEAKPSLS